MNKSHFKLPRRFLGAVILFAFGGSLTSQTTAGTFTVTTANGSGPGSLLVAVTDANTTPGNHTIEFAVSGTLMTLVPLPVITNNLTFTVRGGNIVTIDGQNTMPILRFATGTTNVLHRLRLVNGYSEGNGGAISNSGNLFLSSCVFSTNTAAFQGGAVFNSGQLTLIDTTLNNNQAQLGGAVYSSGSVDLRRSVLRGNRADFGAAIQNLGVLVINETTVSDNTASQGLGGGIFNSGDLRLTASTIARNLATGSAGQNGTAGRYDQTFSQIGGGGGGGGGGAALGAGIYTTGGTANLTNVTLYGNSCFGGQGGAGGNGDVSNQGPVFIGGDGGRGGGPEGGNGGKGRYPGASQQAGANGGFGSGGGGGGGAGMIAGDGQGGGADGGSPGFGGGAGGKGGSVFAGQFGKGGSGGEGGSGIGGAIFCESGEVNLVNCTVTANTATGGAPGTPGIAQRNPSEETPPSSAGSGIAGGIYNFAGMVTLRNTIIGDNLAVTRHPDLSGNFQSSGWNLIGVSDGAVGLTITDFQNTEARVDQLEDNGGPTWTCALLPGSPAIGTGTSIGAPAADQRGAVRPNGNVDMGAFQVVTRIVPDITWEPPAEITVGTALSAMQLNASATVLGTFTYSPAEGTVLPVGSSHLLTAIFTPADLVNFEVVTNTITISVVKLAQTITFDPLPDRREDDPPFLLFASSDSGLAVSFSIVSGPATVAGNLVSLTGTSGDVLVRAIQIGNGEYHPAAPVERSFRVLMPSGITITEHPHSQIVSEGERTVLTVAAEGPALTYQWQLNGNDIPDATSPALTLNSIGQANAGSYRVVITNSGGSITSNEAVIVVRPKLTIRRASGQVSLSWGFGVLQSSSNLRDWEDIDDAASGYIPSGSEPHRFYRLRD